MREDVCKSRKCQELLNSIDFSSSCEQNYLESSVANSWLWLPVTEVPAPTTSVGIFETVPINKYTMPIYFNSVM